MSASTYADDFGKWKELSNQVASIIYHRGGLTQEVIEDILIPTGVQRNFKQLLTFNAQTKNSNSRALIQAGSVEIGDTQVGIVDKSVIPQLLGIADALQVDEKYAVMLYSESLKRQHIYPGLSITTISEILYNEERKYQLKLLCKLLKYIFTNKHDTAAAAPLRLFFEQIGPDNLFTSLMNQLITHASSTKIQPSSSQVQPQQPSALPTPVLPAPLQPPPSSSQSELHPNTFYSDELVLLSYALFYLVSSFHFNHECVMKALDLLLVLTTKLRQQPLEGQDFFLEAPEDIYNPSVFHAASTTFTSVVVMLFGLEHTDTTSDTHATGYRSSATLPAHYKGPLLVDPAYSVSGGISATVLHQLNSHFMQFLDSYQPVSFHCAILFTFLVFLDRNNPTLCRENLIKIAIALINEPQAVDVVLTVLSEDAMLFMAQIMHKTPNFAEYDITQSEGQLFYQLVGLFMKKSHYARLYTPQTAKPRAFYAFFRFLASSFKTSPDMADFFWEENPPTHPSSYLHFIDGAGDRNLMQHEKFGEKIVHSFLELLTYSVTNADTALQAYQYSDKFRINWGHIFEAIAKHVTDYNPNAWNAGGVVVPTALPPTRALNPMDTKYWDHILSYMAVVLEHSETVRGLMGDNPSWQAISILFQFLMCPVSVLLKAKILAVIAAFAKSERASVLLWELLEQSDLVALSSDPAPIAPAGQNVFALKRRESLAYELLWNESTLHEYPITRALCKLIYQLIKWPLPRTLGMGKRGGLQSYLSFILHEVFVKFDVRAYKNLSEMWSIAADCLSIVRSILKNYKYNPQDSTAQYMEVQGQRMQIPPPAALVLIRDISASHSEIFKKIVSIIEQGATTLLIKREELPYAEKFEQAVKLSLKVLISVFSHVESAKLTVNLAQHLVSGVRPCAVNLAKLVGYPSTSCIPFLSVVLLSCLTKTQYGLAKMFYAHEERDGFIAALAEQLRSTDIKPITDETVNTLSLINTYKNQDDRSGSLKIAIARFLLENITREKPNIAQFYLGFMSDGGEPDLAKNLCLDTILNKLSEPQIFCATEPDLAESFYELLYKLCADTEFCQVVLEFLRDQNFFSLQLSLMPTDLPLYKLVYTTHEIFARAWLFKMVAIDIYMMADNRTYVTELLEILFSDHSGVTDEHEMVMPNRSAAYRCILQHLTVLEHMPRDQLNFVPHQYPQFESAECTTCFRGISIIDLRALYDALVASRITQRAVPGAFSKPESDSRALVEVDNGISEIFTIVDYFRQQNLIEILVRSKMFFFTAWKQLVETIFYSCHSYFGSEQRTEIITELLSAILARASAGTTNSPFLSQMVTLVATLMSRLKQDKANYVSLNDYEMNGKYALATYTYQKIFHQLLQTLFLPGSSRTLRGYLYAAVLDYLTITEIPPDTSSLLASQKDENSKTWFMEELANHYKRNKHDNYETIREVGFGLFLDMIASDAAGAGTDPWRAVALALLDKILRYDEKTRTDITRFLDDRGYLRTLVNFDSIGVNGNIASILTDTEGSAAELLLFHGKLQFLQRIAQTVEGANLLWSNFLLDKMVNCQFIDYALDRQELNAHQKIKEQYDSLLNPVLELGVAMLLMLRKNNQFASEFVLFLDKHSEVLSQIIREKIPSESQKLVTSIFYLLAQQQDILVQQLKNKHTRFHAQLLQLLSQFKNKDMWLYSSNRERSENEFPIALDTLNTLLQYCVCLTSHGGTNIIFAPQMKVESNSTLRAPTPDMNILGTLAGHIVAQYSALQDQIVVLRNYARDASALTDDIIAEIIPTLDVGYLAAEERVAAVSDCLHDLIANKDLSSSKLFNMLEAVMYLLWHHLDHYVLPHKTQAKQHHHQQQLYLQNYYHPANGNQDQALAVGAALSDSDISQLREDSRAILYSSRSPNPLLNQILALVATKKGTNVDVLVQKIKEIIREPAPLVNR